MQEIINKLTKYFGKYEYAVLNNQGRWIVQAELKNVSYLKAMNSQGCHIFIKPVDESFFMLGDDFNVSQLEKYHKHNRKFKPGRLVIESSPGNFQVWMKADKALSNEIKLYWLKKMGSDPGCVPKNRWGRSPGFRNRKDKYKTESGFYPLSKLIWVDWKYKANVPSPSTPGGAVSFIPPVQKPVFKNPVPVSRSNYDKGNESATDFAFALALLRRGFSDTDVANMILNERTEWKNHAGRNKVKYLDRTIKKAKDIIALSK